MNDRELLELAAKATGIEWLPATTEKGIELEPLFGLWLRIHGEPSEHQRRRWNPLTDDGDALRLAVKLGIELFFFPDRVETHIAGGRVPSVQVVSREPLCNDPYAATRRSIVRAAAEIGKTIQ